MKSQTSPEFVIRPASGFSINWKELYASRELFFFFTWRDIKVKYKQTVLGFLWVILQPLLMMLIFTVFFSKVLNSHLPPGINYPVFAFTGLLFWNLFSTGLGNSGNSMVSNAQIIKKIYFPRLIIPVSAVCSALVDFLVALLLFFLLLIYFGIQPSAVFFLYLPVALLHTLAATTGLGLILSSLSVKYRDFRYILPFFIQVMLFITPVIYADTLVQNPMSRMLININPMSGPIHLARSGLSGLTPDSLLLITSAASAVVLLIAGLITFRKTEAYFADLA